MANINQRHGNVTTRKNVGNKIILEMSMIHQYQSWITQNHGAKHQLKRYDKIRQKIKTLRTLLQSL